MLCKHTFPLQNEHWHNLKSTKSRSYGLHLMGLGFYHGDDQELNKTSFPQISLRFRSGSLPDMSTQEIHSKNYLTISAQKLYPSGEDSSCYE